MVAFSTEPRGPFRLSASADFAGGFAPGLGGGRAISGEGAASILLAFPLEDWTTSAAVDLRQAVDGSIHGEVFGADVLGDDKSARAQAQALRSLSLDRDGTRWPDVGRGDSVIAELQRRYDFIRPVCFYSAYEAATSFVIGHRISMRQGARVKAWLADELGDRIDVGADDGVAAFPRPQRLLDAAAVPGINAEKVKRLHGLARAALDGALDTATLAELPEDEALARLEALPGVGPWTAQGILMRGCGVPDAVPTADPISREAVKHFYGLDALPTDEQWREISDRW
ncbi:MAG: DNA-3-methyladenine glycosylase, partial [Chloroflexota bacterium]|nr:DNA-3-methyladenine glycosylase [Chloroflexota bacterium]